MAYKDQLTLKARGIYTYADVLGSVPEGSLSQAVNVVLDKNDVITPRRGFETLPGTITGLVKSLHQYTDANLVNSLIAHHNTNVLSHYDDNTDTWTAYAGNYLPPSSATKIRTVEANKNLYFTTSKGVQKIDTVSAAPIDAGAPEALNIFVQAENPTGPVDANKSVAYRAVFGYYDDNKNLVRGAPSSSLVYENTDAFSKNITIRAYIPTPPVAAGWFVQLYRTTNEVGAPGDELFLAKEYTLTAGDITNKYVDIVDRYAYDTLLGEALYTNASQQGIEGSNYQPPLCADMALYQTYVFFANTEQKYSTSFTFLATAVVGGLNVNDTITLNSIVYTGKAAENIAANEFEIGTSGIPSQDNESTARSFVNVVNGSSSNTALWAVYASGTNDVPGLVRIFERDYGDATAFTVTSSEGGAFSPDISTARVSENEKSPNRIYYSKSQTPEAVPSGNYFDVGSATSPILRILPLQSILLIFKTDGIYRLTGTTESSFQVSLLDNTSKLLAPESLVNFNNSAIGLFDQGVAQISGSSIQVVSRAVEGELLEIRGTAGDKVFDLSFGIGYDSDRKYMIYLPQADDDTQCTIGYVYNTATGSWTTYDLTKSFGLVRSKDDKLYLASDAKIAKERKDYNEFDYSDEAIATTVSVVDGTKLRLTIGNITDAVVGYVYYESAGKFSTITEVDVVNAQIAVADPLDWTVGTFEMRPYIATIIEWNPVTTGSPHVLKQFAECVLMVEKPVSDATLSFKTVLSADYEDVSLIDETVGLWGLFPWGEVPWGGESIRNRYRTYIPRNKQKDTLIVAKLTQNSVFAPFEIAGISYYYRDISNRAGR